MHGFPDWFGLLLGAAAWCIDRRAVILAVVVLIVACLVWRRRLVAFVAGVLWLAFELTRPLHRRLRSWLASTFCKHSFEFMFNLFGDQINEWGGKRSVWKCTRCGKLRARDGLHQEEASAQ
jgi:hypothetical protein